MNRSELEKIVREVIRKVGDKYAVYPKSGGKRLGTHSTKAAAEKQLTAIHLNKEGRENVYKGIPRTALPQIHTKDIKDQYMYREGNVLLSEMIPVQIERVKEEFESALEGIKKGDKIKPIMLDKRGFIVNGHHRYDAYKALGYERAPAVVVNASLKELMIKFTNESLHSWFNKEKWVRITTAGNIAGPCGTSKNKKNPDRCLPKAKAQSLTKAQRAATARKKKAAGAKGKQVVKNTEKAKVTREDITNLVVGMIYEARGIEVLTEEDDRCTRIAKQKYDTWPSAYASGAVVRCRRGEIWKKK